MLNVDLSQRVVMRTASMDWQASPSSTVWRKRLDHLGGEFSRVTSVVRYDAGSHFHAHGHPNGEEILVLSGVFSDESGDYPVGSFLLNPEGFEHAPFSKPGCVIFVKLQQYPGTNRRHVTLNFNDADWQAGGAAGVESLSLYSEAGFAEVIELLRLAPGAVLPARDAAGGEEVFVMAGEVADELGQYPEGSWVRTPPGPRPALTSAKGATIYRKSDHLPGQARTDPLPHSLGEPILILQVYLFCTIQFVHSAPMARRTQGGSSRVVPMESQPLTVTSGRTAPLGISALKIKPR